MAFQGKDLAVSTQCLSTDLVTDVRVVTMSLESHLLAVGAGDRAAFRQLFELFGSIALGIAMRILREREAAEDAVQEAFLRVWRMAASFDPARGNARSWLHVLVRNAALDQLRTRKPAASIDDIDLSGFATFQPEAPDNRLRQCLDRLPAEQARAIVTMYHFGMSHSELADHLALPLGTVKSWVRRGTQSLRHCMDDTADGICDLAVGRSEQVGDRHAANGHDKVI